MTVERTVLREQIKAILLERIPRGELEPGRRLVETAVALSNRERRWVDVTVEVPA